MTDNASGVWRGTDFRKSSYSGQNAECVEVARVDARFGLRDSKNPRGPLLAIPAERGYALLTAIKREQINTP